MTIYEEFGRFEQLKVAIVGDITHSRVAKSNMQILKRLGAELYFAGPEQWYSDEFYVYGKHVDLGASTNCDAISTSRLTGAGCMIIADGFKRL